MYSLLGILLRLKESNKLILKKKIFATNKSYKIIYKNKTSMLMS